MSQHHARIANDSGLLRRQILVHRARYRCERCEHRVSASRVSRVGARRCELHHVVPLSEGGMHNPNNVELLCVQCHVQHHRDERVQQMPPDRREWAELL